MSIIESAFIKTMSKRLLFAHNTDILNIKSFHLI